MGETVGVLSILEGKMLNEAKRLWKLFETEYASKGVQSFDFPNMTFQGGQCRDLPGLKDALVALARQLQPFEVIIDGLAYFESHPNVVFLKVQPSDSLRRIQEVVHETLEPYCENLFPNYRPETWTPHVTVAMNDLTDPAFRRALHDLRDYHPYYRQTISNIHLVHVLEETGRIEIVASVSLTQRSTSD